MDQSVKQSLDRLEQKIDGNIIVSNERFDKHEHEEWTIFDGIQNSISEASRVNAIISARVDRVERDVNSAFDKIRKAEWKIWIALVLCVSMLIYNFYLQWTSTL